ncbi:MAG: ATP-binding cassette domain-containing protein, partial [Rhodospirillaceae bacterium]
MSRLLEIKDLSVSFGAGAREIRAVRDVNFHIDKGETVALVGESGSGTSVTALSVIRLLPYPLAHHPSGSITFEGEELIDAPDNRMRTLCGNDIAMIFQEPLTSLNPLHSIEKQIAEVLLLHKAMTPVQARARVVELLTLVGLE